MEGDTLTRHHLKIWPEHFEAVTHEDSKQRKTVELRYDDRGYSVGDVLVLEEWDRERGYTGRRTERLVTHVLSGGLWLRDGYVAMSICEIE